MNKRLLTLPDYKHTCSRYTTGDINSRCLACAYESGAKDQYTKTLKEVGERIGHCDEIRDPDKNEVLIYYGVKPKMVGALKQGRMPE